MSQVIVLDCAPFTSRPDEVLPMALGSHSFCGVVKGLFLASSPP